MDEQTSVLVVDDDPIVLNSLAEYLRLEDYEVSSASDMDEAIDLLEGKRFRIALIDVRLPKGNGFDLLAHINKCNLPIAVIVFTGYGSIEDAVKAVKMGAFDYVTKPLSDDEVKLAVERALHHQELLAENKSLRQQLKKDMDFETLICRDPKMERVKSMIQAVVGINSSVLITGESGTGKTLAAKAIHANSPRAKGPFIEVSCGTLPETLLESELFGHVKGAFSGAINNKRGKFEAAHGGTLFLDEISLASPSLQAKLLRVLEDFQFEPVGSNDTRRSDVRLVLATNEDLSQLVKEGKFRRDLYYRINVMNIHLPPLRERTDDILPLAHHFVDKYRKQAIHPVEGVSEEAMHVLVDYAWPGNVRELENVIQRAIVFCRSRYIQPEDLDIKGAARSDNLLDDGNGLPLKQALKRVERRLILDCLRECQGNRKKAAKELGINRTTLYNKLHEHDLMAALDSE